jgi:mRNA interferase MazF
VVIGRGDVFWVDLGEQDGSRPARRRPVLVVQDDAFNSSRLATAIVAVLTSNLALAAMPGNVLLPAHATGLPRDSVVNVTALVTVDKRELVDRAGTVPPPLLSEVSLGLRLVLSI